MKPKYEVFRRGHLYNYDTDEVVPNWHWCLRVNRREVVLHESGFYRKEDAIEHCRFVQGFINKAKDQKIHIRKRALKDV